MRTRFAFLVFTLTFFASTMGHSQGPISYFKTQEPSVHYFKMDPHQVKMDILLSAEGLTASEFRKRHQSVLVINGSFFDVNGKSMGLMIRHGVEANPLRQNSWPVFLLGGKDAKTPFIITREEWQKNQKKYGNVQLALQVGPRLVVDGKIQSFKESLSDKRSAIGITKDGQLLIAMSESPLWLKDWATLLSRYCVTALNLDGGGSSQISFHDKGISINIDGDTPVPNAISVSY